MAGRSRRKGGAKGQSRSLPVVFGAIGLALVGLLAWYALGRGNGGLGRVGGDLHSLLVTVDGRFIYGQHSGVQVSSDGGKTWTAPSGTGDAMALSASPRQPDTIYQAGHGLFLKSEDAGRTWQEPGFGNLPSSDIHGFAVGPAGEALYANVAGRGLHVSWDEGKTWEFVTRATADAMALAAGPGPGESPALYALSMSQGPIGSQDGGNTWSRIGGVPKTSGSGIHVHPRSGNLYLTGEGGVYRSRDRGESWQELGPPVAMALIAAHPEDESKLVAVARNGQVYRSEDGGESWL